MNQKNSISKPLEKTALQQKNAIPVLLLSLIVIPFIIYFKSLNNQFINWDDNSYVTHNADIRTLHGDSISVSLQKTFSSYVLGNYHPLTMLSYSMEYTAFKLNPKPYHITNLVLHILNTLLVFYFIYLLTQQHIVAYITALLFSIHPMHVESVVWIAERKDLLYTFFYLCALCTYLFYLKNDTRKTLFYSLTIILFVFSLLSKGMAVSFTLLLFAIDYFFNRKFSKQTIIEKIPFIVLSLAFGSVAIAAQQHTKALDIADYNFFERLLFSCYGLITYLWKLIIPVNLSCFYAYPVKNNSGLYPIIYYITPLLLIILGYFIYKSKNNSKDILFGVGFFIITLLMVLQVLPVGSSIVSERYTYIPYIGLFFIIARWINTQLNESTKTTSSKRIIVGVLSICVGCSMVQSFNRTKVWHDSISLWTDAIKKDKTNPFLYDNRANSYYLENQYEQAITDFTYAINHDYEELKVFFKRGSAYYAAKKYTEALADFNSAVKENAFDSILYYKRGYIYAQLGNFNDAINDYDHMILIDPKFSEAYHDRGLVYLYKGDYKQAITDFNKAILLNKNYPAAYLSRGSAYFITGQAEEAIESYSLAINYSRDYKDAYYNRAIAYLSMKKYEFALKNALKAKELGYSIPENLLKDIRAGIGK